MFKSLVLVLPLVVWTASASYLRAQGSDEVQRTPQQVFDQRILPIFRSEKPSSCVQCHLAAVDLKNYILPTQEQTFVSLRDQGLINLDAPSESKILTLIRMGEKDLDDGARLIHAQVRRAEYTAFANWIEACCRDSQLRNLPPLTAKEWARPHQPDEVIRHARKSRIVDSFARNVYSQRMRCFPCHTPHEVDPSNPAQQAALKTLRQFEERYEPAFLKRLELFRDSPEATMEYLIKRSRNPIAGERPMIDLQNPRESLFVLKPMSRIPPKNENGELAAPSSVDPVTHMGGLKMHPDDQSYKSIVAWIQDYANVVGNRYASVDELPADNWHATQLVLRLTAAPDDWPVGAPVQLFVHSWSEADAAWNHEPIAFTQGVVTPRKMVNGTLFLLSQQDTGSAAWDPGAAKLERGDYLLKAYVDDSGQMADDPSLLLGESDYRGQAVLKNARWREGFRSAETISGRSLEGE